MVLHPASSALTAAAAKSLVVFKFRSPWGMGTRMGNAARDGIPIKRKLVAAATGEGAQPRIR
jgi:hypothetical protein